MAITRCPRCGRFGSSDLADFCRPCYKKRYIDEDEKHAFADFCGNHVDGAFFPKEFNTIKDTFGYEDR
jgi:hypothetical protein